MSLEEFTQLVKDMRAAQKAYFKARTPAALEESKRLERLVDQAIEAGEIPEGHGYQQASLFTGPDESGPYRKGV
jgi:hypothetical protein